jgi:hypothetical protein
VTWSGNTRLTTHTADDQRPALGEDADGKIWVVWQSEREDDYEIYYKTYDDSSWSQEVDLSQNLATDVEPSITHTSDGRIWVVWSSDRKDGNFEIYYRIFDGNSWSSVKRLTNNQALDGYPAVVGSVDGRVWVVWSTNRDGGSEIYYTIFDGTSWSGDTRLTVSPGAKQHPSVAETSEGEIWVAYTKAGEVCYMRYDGVNWSEESHLYDAHSDTDWSSVTQTCDGIMCVAYCSARNGNQDIYAQLTQSTVSAGVEAGGDGPAFSTLTVPRVSPNPFGGKTTIEFTVPKTCLVEMAIYNMLGQRVTVLLDAMQSGGHHTIGWDGTDSSGRPVSPGVYLCRLEVGRQVSCRKIVVIR